MVYKLFVKSLPEEVSQLVDRGSKKAGIEIRDWASRWKFKCCLVAISDETPQILYWGLIYEGWGEYPIYILMSKLAVVLVRFHSTYAA